VKSQNSRIFWPIFETENFELKTGVSPSFNSPLASDARRGKNPEVLLGLLRVLDWV